MDKIIKNGKVFKIKLAKNGKLLKSKPAKSGKKLFGVQDTMQIQWEKMKKQ